MKNLTNDFKHTHNYKDKGNYFECKCGKIKLKFNKSKKGLMVGTRRDGKTYTAKDNKDRFFFPDEYVKFEKVLKSKQLFSVKVLLNTGARINECRHIKKEDIDFNGKRIVLRKTKTKAKKKEKKGKIRIIPISTQFTKYLKKELKDKKPGDYIGVLSNPALNIAYKKAGEKAKIKNFEDISSHTFRKTLEVWLIGLEVHHMKILAHFGHDLSTAMSSYVSPDIFSHDDKRDMKLIIGDLYGR